LIEKSQKDEFNFNVWEKSVWFFYIKISVRQKPRNISNIFEFEIKKLLISVNYLSKYLN
jgi:hypothetical protein